MTTDLGTTIFALIKAQVLQAKRAANKAHVSVDLHASDGIATVSGKNVWPTTAAVEFIKLALMEDTKIEITHTLQTLTVSGLA